MPTTSSPEASTIGPLHGIPIGLKDLLVARDGPTTAQSIVHDPEWGGGHDATAVARLRASGAVITGKTTLNEFGCGEYGASEAFPAPTNPWDPSRWAGGSSSGSAAGIAAGFFLGALGSDTGGSLRIPAACCGVSALKPTFGLVPTSGFVPFAFSFDHIGPMGRSIRDCGHLLRAIAGHSSHDAYSATRALAPFVLDGTGLDGVRVGVVREHHFPAGTDPSLAPVFDTALGVLEQRGATLHEVRLPHYVEASAAFMLIETAEALAYHRERLQERWSDYTAGSRLLFATGALASAADYVQAQRVRRVVQLETARLFEHVDVIATPTTATPALRFEDMAAMDLDAMMSLFFTQYWNLTGNPALSVPMGMAAGAPLGLQLIGRPFEDGDLIRAADAYQHATGWHLQSPPAGGATSEELP